MPLAPVERRSASGFQKAFGHLLADVVGASSALQHIHSPWPGHLQPLPEFADCGGGFHARKISPTASLVKRAARIAGERRAAFTTAGAASKLAEIGNFAAQSPDNLRV